MLEGSPVVAAAHHVLLVDLTVRFAPAPGEEDALPVEWDAAWDDAVHAVIQTAVRLVADDHPSSELLGGRAFFDDAVRRHLGYAPVPIRFTVAATTVEVRPHQPDFANHHSFRDVPA